MQQIDFFMVDAFTTTTFGSNTVTVCPFTDWLSDETLLKMAWQHNRSETALFVVSENGFELRWFTIQGKINLYGHATLTATHVIFEHLNCPDAKIQLATHLVGPLTITHCSEQLALDFPAWQNEPVMPLALLLETLGITGYREVRVTRDYAVVLKNQQQVEAARPNIHAMIPLGKMVCITASGDGEYDFVSRFFCPSEAVTEDPVTGSARSVLIPYWAEKLNKTQMLARQVSGHGGDLRYQLTGTHVYISGQTIAYLAGKVLLHQQPYPK